MPQQLQSQRHTVITVNVNEQPLTVILPIDIGDGDGQVSLAVAQRLVEIGGNDPAEYAIVGEIDPSSSGTGSPTGADTTTTDTDAPTGAESTGVPSDTQPPADGANAPTGTTGEGLLDGDDQDESDDDESDDMVTELLIPPTRTPKRGKR